MSCIKDDTCLDSMEYVELVTGDEPVDNISLEELEEMELDLWNYPLTEIEHIIENNLNVVLVRFPEMYGGYDYRFCEVPDEEC